MSKIHYANALTGGAADALDFIDGDTLTDLDLAFVFTGSLSRLYRLNATSGAAESSPQIIAPDTNPGNKRWILQSPKGRVTDAFWHTVNGYGSGSTKIQKFTTEVGASDDVVVTVVNSATLGFTITANMACIAHLTFVGSFSSATSYGFSKNSNQLTTNVEDITTAHRVAFDRFITANLFNSVSWSGLLATSDVIRPHTNGQTDGSTPAWGSITVVAIEVL